MKINEILNEYWMPRGPAEAQEDFIYNAEEFEEGGRSYIGQLVFVDDWQTQVTRKVVQEYIRTLKRMSVKLDRWSGEEEAVDTRLEATYLTLLSTGLAKPRGRQ